MKRYCYGFLILAIFLALPAVWAATDFEDQYRDLRSEYYNLVDKYTHYKEGYLDAQDSDEYYELKYERDLRDVKSDFSSLEDDAITLIGDIRDADGSEALIDDVKDLRDNAADFQNRIEDLIGGDYYGHSDYDDHYYNHYDYYYDEYGYYVKEPVKAAAPEPSVTVEPLNVYFVSSVPSNPAPTAPVAAPKIITAPADFGIVWLLAGIVMLLATIIFLISAGIKKK
ncbi:MAG: hypothetical protein V2A62_04805 [Candidatus Woesearchaeota archaeon]